MIVRWQWAQDAWWGEDKIQHFGWSGWLMTVLWMACPLWQAIVLFVLIAILVELAEAWRMERWDGVGPWPFLCDWPSYKDLVWDGLGAVSAVIAATYVINRDLKEAV